MSPIANDTQAKKSFWDSVERRAAEAPFCRACNRFFFYPRPFCPTCWSEEVEFRLLAGGGTVWSYTIVRFDHGNAARLRDLPYTVALVALDEGIRVMGNIADCPPDEVHSGMRVRLTYARVGDRTLPSFIRA